LGCQGKQAELTREVHSKLHTGRSGQTVLHHYASVNNPDTIAMLLAQGADPNVRVKSWHATPLGHCMAEHLSDRLSRICAKSD
jgi:ankyrin repeat protein